MQQNVKILVCITPQQNSKRLIDKGFEVTKEQNGELHILHVEKGTNIFLKEGTSLLLQELFDYGSNCGGIIHGVCGNEVFDTIIEFIKKNNISHVVLGETPVNVASSDDMVLKLKNKIPKLEVIILKRNV